MPADVRKPRVLGEWRCGVNEASRLWNVFGCVLEANYIFFLLMGYVRYSSIIY